MLSTRTAPFAFTVKGVDVAKNPGPFLEGLDARGKINSGFERLPEPTKSAYLTLYWSGKKSPSSVCTTVSLNLISPFVHLGFGSADTARISLFSSKNTCDSPTTVVKITSSERACVCFVPNMPVQTTLKSLSSDVVFSISMSCASQATGRPFLWGTMKMVLLILRPHSSS